MSEPPWDRLDPGIVRAVRALYDAGLEPYRSCQGNGAGGSGDCAWVTCSGTDAERAMGALLAEGYDDMTVRVHRSIKDGVMQPSCMSVEWSYWLTPEGNYPIDHALGWT